MELSVEYLTHGIKKINLMGRMDIIGIEKIELVLTALTTSVKARLIIDLTRVNFVSSAGIGVLLRSVKAARVRGGEAVLLTSRSAVTGTLAATHMNKVVRMFGELNSACNALLPAAERST